VDGYRETALFMNPSGVSIAPSGDIIVSDSGNHVIRRIDDEFVITIAGNGTAGYQNGREGEARFNWPRAAVMCPDGYIYVADTMNHALRLIDPAGNVTLLAGSPGVSGFMDGPISEALFFEPSGLYLTPDGRVLYIADAANHAIRKIENGTVTTIAGQPENFNRFTGYFEGGYVDGPNNEARFNFPRDITLLAGVIFWCPTALTILYE
jgi:DNA-binding beta-propeller fold protein YncE